jgi:hypothetical protein
MNDIRKLERQQIEDFHNLVKTVYDEFVAVEYSEEGNKTFYSYIDQKEIEKRYDEGQLFYVCMKNNKIVGALEIRNMNHIALFFVEKKHHMQNIGKDLFKYYLNDLDERHIKLEYIEVNSSPYAKKIYERLGFRIESDLQETNGIKFYYMKRY